MFQNIGSFAVCFHDLFFEIFGDNFHRKYQL